MVTLENISVKLINLKSTAHNKYSVNIIEWVMTTGIIVRIVEKFSFTSYLVLKLYSKGIILFFFNEVT